MNGKIIEKAPSTSMEFTCEATGSPRPLITWFRNKKPFIVDGKSGIKLEKNGQRLIFARLVEKDSGFYECLIENRGGILSRSVTLNVIGNEGLKLEDVVLSVILITVFTIMIFMAVYIGKKIRQERVSIVISKRNIFLIIFYFRNKKEN